MKDPHDKKTGDMLASTSAQRQAAYKARREAQGFKRTTVWIHEGAWQAGYDAGLTGKSPTPVPTDLDGLSWLSGYIEGDAKRQQGGA